MHKMDPEDVKLARKFEPVFNALGFLKPIVDRIANDQTPMEHRSIFLDAERPRWRKLGEDIYEVFGTEGLIIMCGILNMYFFVDRRPGFDEYKSSDVRHLEYAWNNIGDFQA